MAIISGGPISSLPISGTAAAGGTVDSNIYCVDDGSCMVEQFAYAEQDTSHYGSVDEEPVVDNAPTERLIQQDFDDFIFEDIATDWDNWSWAQAPPIADNNPNICVASTDYDSQDFTDFTDYSSQTDVTAPNARPYSIKQVATVSFTTSASGNFTVTFPSVSTQTPREGDCYLLSIAYRGNATITAPTGWTEVQQQATGDTSTTQGTAGLAMFIGFRTGSADPGTDFTRTGGDVAYYSMVRIRGVDPVNPINGSTSAIASAFGTTVTTTGLTTTRDGCYLYFFGAGGDNFAPSSMNFASRTDIGTEAWGGVWNSNTTTTGADTSLGIHMSTMQNAGSTGDLTATFSGSDDKNGVCLVALNPLEPQAITVNTSRWFVSTFNFGTGAYTAGVTNVLFPANTLAVVTTGYARAFTDIISNTDDASANATISDSFGLTWTRQVNVGNGGECIVWTAPVGPNDVTTSFTLDHGANSIWTYVGQIYSLRNVDLQNPVVQTAVSGVGPGSAPNDIVVTMSAGVTLGNVFWKGLAHYSNSLGYDLSGSNGGVTQSADDGYWKNSASSNAFSVGNYNQGTNWFEAIEPITQVGVRLLTSTGGTDTTYIRAAAVEFRQSLFDFNLADGKGLDDQDWTDFEDYSFSLDAVREDAGAVVADLIEVDVDDQDFTDFTDYSFDSGPVVDDNNPDLCIDADEEYDDQDWTDFADYGTQTDVPIADNNPDICIAAVQDNDDQDWTDFADYGTQTDVPIADNNPDICVAAIALDDQDFTDLADYGTQTDVPIADNNPDICIAAVQDNDDQDWTDFADYGSQTDLTSEDFFVPVDILWGDGSGLDDQDFSDLEEYSFVGDPVGPDFAIDILWGVEVDDQDFTDFTDYSFDAGPVVDDVNPEVCVASTDSDDQDFTDLADYGFASDPVGPDNNPNICVASTDYDDQDFTDFADYGTQTDVPIADNNPDVCVAATALDDQDFTDFADYGSQTDVPIADNNPDICVASVDSDDQDFTDFADYGTQTDLTIEDLTVEDWPKGLQDNDDQDFTDLADYSFDAGPVGADNNPNGPPPSEDYSTVDDSDPADYGTQTDPLAPDNNPAGPLPIWDEFYDYTDYSDYGFNDDPQNTDAVPPPSVQAEQPFGTGGMTLGQFEGRTLRLPKVIDESKRLRRLAIKKRRKQQEQDRRKRLLLALIHSLGLLDDED